MHVVASAHQFARQRPLWWYVSAAVPVGRQNAQPLVASPPRRRNIARHFRTPCSLSVVPPPSCNLPAHSQMSLGICARALHQAHESNFPPENPLGFVVRRGRFEICGRGGGPCPVAPKEPAGRVRHQRTTL